jgi:hypothetical protein
MPDIIKEKMRHAVGIAEYRKKSLGNPLQQHRHVGQVQTELVAKVHALSICGAMQLSRTCTATNTTPTLVSIIEATAIAVV